MANNKESLSEHQGLQIQGLKSHKRVHGLGPHAFIVASMSHRMKLTDTI